ncbi:MAG: DUF421 domain-containing protein [Bacilli bacterium]|nr:DUF421 domain-containing protein [Bacilli bacterium]
MLIMVLTARAIISFIELIIIKVLIEKNKYEELDKYISIILLIIIGSSILNYKDNILMYIVPIIMILFLRQVILYNRKVKNFFEKDPILLVKNSKIVYKNLLNSNYNLEKLLNELKKRKIYDLKEIKYVFLSDNKLFIVNYENNIKENNEIIIMDTKIDKENLRKLGLSEKYIKNILLKENINIDDIVFGVYKNKKIYIIRNNLLK